MAFFTSSTFPVVNLNIGEMKRGRYLLRDATIFFSSSSSRACFSILLTASRAPLPVFLVLLPASRAPFPASPFSFPAPLFSLTAFPLPSPVSRPHPSAFSVSASTATLWGAKLNAGFTVLGMNLAPDFSLRRKRGKICASWKHPCQGPEIPRLHLCRHCS